MLCLGLPGRTQTNVFFVEGPSSWVLIDAGWARDAARIREAAEALAGAGGRVAEILLTHAHPDHSGGALALARAWDCPVWMHPAELPIACGDFAAMAAAAGPLDRWVILPAMRAMGRRRREAVLTRSSMGALARAFDPGDGAPGLPGWACIPTPGHTPGHVAYFRPTDRVLIAGDAVVTLRVNALGGIVLGRPGLSGPPWCTTWDAEKARASIRAASRLDPAVLAGGHGPPMTGPGTADALRAFAARLARLG